MGNLSSQIFNPWLKNIFGLFVAVHLGEMIRCKPAKAAETKAAATAAPAAAAAAAAKTATEPVAEGPISPETIESLETAEKTLDANVLVAPKFAKSKESLLQIKENIRSCSDWFEKARTYCLEELNPDINKAVAGINIIASGINGAGVMSQCDSMGKIMDIANKAMTLFSTSCSIFKGSCTFTCDPTTAGLTRFITDAEAEYSICLRDYPIVNAGNQLANTQCNQVNTGFQKLKQRAKEETNEVGFNSIALRAKNCKFDFALNAASALAGIVGSIVPMLNTSNSCKKQTEAFNQFQKVNGGGDPKKHMPAPSDPFTPPEDCSSPANSASPKCICLANPRTPGCDNVLSKGGGGATGVFAGNNNPLSKSGGLKSNSIPFGLGDGSTDKMKSGAAGDKDRSKAADGGPGLPGAPSGGGMGLGGGGSGSGGGNGSSSGNGQNKLNTNIYGGSDGGGGGGGFGGSGLGSKSPNALAIKRLHDAHAAKWAAYNKARKEIGFAGGSSIFERIHQTYVNLRPSVDVTPTKGK